MEAIKGQRTLNELAKEYGVHPNQIGIWKKKLLEIAPEVFSRGKDRDAERAKEEPSPECLQDWGGFQWTVGESSGLNCRCKWLWNQTMQPKDARCQQVMNSTE